MSLVFLICVILKCGFLTYLALLLNLLCAYVIHSFGFSELLISFNQLEIILFEFGVFWF